MQPGPRHKRRREDHAAVERRRRQRLDALRKCTPQAAGAVAVRRALRREARHDGQLQLCAVIPSPVDDSIWGVSEQPRLPRPAAARANRLVVQGGSSRCRSPLRSPQRGRGQPRRRLDGARSQRISRASTCAQIERARESTGASAAKAGRCTRRRTEAEGHADPGGLPLLQLVDQKTSLASAPTRRLPPARTRTLLALNPQTGVDDAARALPARLLSHERPHRRCERQMEGRALRELQHALRGTSRAERARRARSNSRSANPLAR